MQVQDVSSNQIAMDEKRSPSKSTAKNTAAVAIPINIDTIDELSLDVDPKNEEDLRELSKILVQLLNYPRSDIAETHSEAMKLGNFDLQNATSSSEKERLNTSSELMEGGGDKRQFCPCCGFIKQQDNIKLCTPLDGIKNMGLSTYLFFATFKNLSILLMIMILIYSIFALLTNVLASNKIDDINSLNFDTVDYITISLAAKQLHDTPDNRRYYYISCWLGVAMLLIWILVLIAIKYKEVKDSQEYDQDTISCSDYSVVVEGLPVDVDKGALGKQLDQYYENTVKDNQRFPGVWRTPLTVAKVNVGKPFYLSQQAMKDQELENINKDIQETREILVQWVKERQSYREFRTPKAQREALYAKYIKLNERKMEKYLQLSKKVRTLLKNESTHDLTTVFVTFETSNAMKVMSFVHEQGLLNKLRSLCSDQFKRFNYKQGQDEFSNLQIRRAPEPQDILWENIGYNTCSIYGRKFFTYFVTALLLGASFGIVFGLTKAQESANDNRLISIAISATIGIINPILGIVIKFLTFFQKDYTATNRQASLAIKSIIAQMINSILIPVVTAYQIKQNIYQTSGLVDNIFMLGITTTMIPPLVVLIDPYNIFMKIVRCIKSRPSSKLYQNQKEHCIIHEGIEFQIGFHYIYIANSFIFVCFFVSLQPIVSLFALIGYFMMFWVQKYCIFNRYKRPIPGTDFVNNAVWRMIFLGPFVFSMGSLTWSNLSPNGIPEEALLPNLVCIGISVLLYFMPMNTIIFGSCFDQNYEKSKNYIQERIFFPSEYDRLNPSTQEEGVNQYKEYMAKKVKQLQNSSEEKKRQFAQILGRNAQRGQLNQQGAHKVPGGNILGSMFGGGQSMMPMMAPQQPMMYPMMPQPQFMSGFMPGMAGMPAIPGYQPYNINPMASGVGQFNPYSQPQPQRQSMNHMPQQHAPIPVYGAHQQHPHSPPKPQQPHYGIPPNNPMNPLAAMNLGPQIHPQQQYSQGQHPQQLANAVQRGNNFVNRQNRQSYF